MRNEDEHPNIENFEDFMVDLTINQTAIVLSDNLIGFIRDMSKENEVMRDNKAKVYKILIERLTAELDNIESDGGINVK